MLPALDYPLPASSQTDSASVHHFKSATTHNSGSPAADTYSRVDIAMEMPRYLLQEDETTVDEISEEHSVNAPNDPQRVSKQSSVLASCFGKRQVQTVDSECVSDIAASVHKTSVDMSSPSPRPLTVCYPLVNLPKGHQLLHSSHVISLNATPISIATSSRRLERKKHHPYGGGWPKGRSRKVKGEMSPPKPPSTGYVAGAQNRQSFI